MGLPLSGSSCRAAGGGEGVITAIVRNANRDPCLLSCSHVLASGVPSAQSVVEWLDTSGSAPAWRRAGTLWKWVQFTPNGVCNSLDVALALLDGEIAESFRTLSPIGVAPYDNRYTGAPMRMFNAFMNRWDAGSIRELFTEQDFTFGQPLKLCGLIESSIENRPGDSGRVILVEDTVPFGIHVAGNSVTKAWSIPLERAFAAWGLELINVETPA